MTTFLLLLAGALFILLNIIIGCYVMIQFGYGPPNWQTALNLIVPLTTLQDLLNDGREWLEEKAPWADKLLTRLHVPKPIIIVDTTPIVEEEEEIAEEAEAEEAPEEEAEETGEEPVDEQTAEPPDNAEMAGEQTAEPQS